MGDDAQEIQSTAMGMGVALIFWFKGIGKTKEKPPKF